MSVSGHSSSRFSESYKLSLGTNGFPLSTKESEITEIAIRIGDFLAAKQDEVVFAQKNPKIARQDRLVAINQSGNPYYLLEIAADDIIRGTLRLGQSAPDAKVIGFLSGETGREAAENYWVIDPIRNFKDYVEGGKDWSLSIGFAAAGKPTGGLIYSPAKQDMIYTGDKGLSYRRAVTGHYETPIVLKGVTQDLSVKGVAAPIVLVAEFAKNTAVGLSAYNPDILSNVALQAIVSRVESHDRDFVPVLPNLTHLSPDII